MARTALLNAHRLKTLITITAGVPIFVADGDTPILADRLLIIILPGGTGTGLVYDDVPIGMTAAQVAAGGDLPVPLASPSVIGAVNQPGGSYSDASQAGIDLRQIAIDGTNTGDQVLVDAHLKI
jgi:hypothetical protein